MGLSSLLPMLLWRQTKPEVSPLVESHINYLPAIEKCRGKKWNFDRHRAGRSVRNRDKKHPFRNVILYLWMTLRSQQHSSNIYLVYVFCPLDLLLLLPPKMKSQSIFSPTFDISSSPFRIISLVNNLFFLIHILLPTKFFSL